ncbi:MAG TPA: SLOG family protein [Gemmataceae bacterium]|jgi:hypothetical protein
MRVIVTGSTTWIDAEAIRRELSKLPPESTVVHGDSPGVDALAGQVARKLGLVVEAFAKQTDDYRHYGRGAWKRLNERMLESGVDLVLAFHPEWGEPGKARGSGHLAKIAEKHGVEVRCFRS